MNNLTDEKEGYDNDFDEFLSSKGLSRCKDALVYAGLENLQMIKELDDEMIEEIMKDANLKKLHQKLLRKAIKEFKEFKEPDDPFAELREQRKDLKGYVERKSDTFTGRKETKTIIFIGQTGVGKTTFINSMCNYLEQVSYKEQFRYKLIDEDKDDEIKSKEVNIQSRTHKITKYHLENVPAINQYPFKALTIVDTPGFGDTKGVKVDMEIRDKFKYFFENNCSFIDGVYFIIKSTETRVGAMQKYIFKLVLDLFGEDIKENIFILFTFSDGSDPNGLQTVNKYFFETLKIKEPKYFKINNSGFSFPVPDKRKDLFHENFFNMGMGLFKTIFDELSKVQTKSTKQTQETLKERGNIEAGLKKIQEKLKLQLISRSMKKDTQFYLMIHMDKIKKNKNYKIPTQKTVVYADNVTHNNYTTYCKICNETCCNDCNVESWKYWCAAMDWRGNCTICARKCGMKHHRHENFIIRRKIETTYETISQMAKRLIKDENATCDEVIEALQTDMEKNDEEILAKVQKMKDSVTRLQEIALNKKVVSKTNEEYFYELIKMEEKNREEGWEKRVEELTRMKKRETICIKYTK